jgi:hypothetical protein
MLSALRAALSWLGACFYAGRDSPAVGRSSRSRCNGAVSRLDLTVIFVSFFYYLLAYIASIAYKSIYEIGYRHVGE